MHFEVTKATPKDASVLGTILEEGRQYKLSHGDYGWDVVPFTESDALEIIGHGITYLGKIDGQHAGCIDLQWDDESIWGERGMDGQAGYVHRLAVRSRFRGQKIGSLLIGWAAQTVIEVGRPLIRLDCNPALTAYYANLGFSHVGRAEMPTYSTELLERLACTY